MVVVVVVLVVVLEEVSVLRGLFSLPDNGEGKGDTSQEKLGY